MNPDNAPINPNQPAVPNPAVNPGPAPAPVAPAPFTAPQAAGSADWYTSNPFLVSVKGLVLVLQHNPVPALLAAFVVIGLVIVYLIVIVVLSLVLKSAGTAGNILTILLAMLGYIVAIPLVTGTYIAIAAASSKEEKISVSDALKRAFGKLLPLIGLMILCGIMTLVGFILLIIPGIILIGRLSLSAVAMFEEELGPIKAIKRSFELTKGHTIEMLGALFAGSFLSGNGLISPAASLAPLVGRYNELKRLKESGAAKPSIHWLNFLMPIIALVFIAGMVLLMLFAPKTPTTAPSTNPYKFDSNSQFKFDESEFEAEFNRELERQTNEFNFE